jgi:hypothetical protein
MDIADLHEVFSASKSRIAASIHQAEINRNPRGSVSRGNN